MRAFVALFVFLLASTGSWAAPSPADDAFVRIFEAEWAWRLKQFPQLATAVGVHDSDDQLGHVDARTQRQRLRHLRGVARDLDALETKALSAPNQINHTIYASQISNAIKALELKSYLLPMTSDSSFYGDLTGLANTHPFRTVTDYQNYIARLNAVGAYFKEHIALLEEGAKKGMTLPQVVLKGRDAPMQAIIDSSADLAGNPFFAPFKKFPSTISSADAKRLSAEGRRAIERVVIPAYSELKTYFNERYLPRARLSLGASELPNGAAYYRLQIREFTTLSLSADEIHQIGLREVKRIALEMEAVKTSAGFAGTLQAFIAFLRSDDQFYAKTPRELMMAASYIAKKIDGELPKYFTVLPRLPYGVVPVPANIAPYYTSGRYSPAPEGGRSAGFYWVNTFALRSRPLYALPALTLHEAVPGHHLQIALAAEQGSQPPFRRYSYISAFGEGWALYAEYLGLEMGIYETPYEQFGRLTYEMWRALRLVIDTGIHSKGWTREQSLALLRDNTALSELEVKNEIDRYISWPGQALSYKLGELKIKELRAFAEKTLGADFDLRWFHDAVLRLGSVPLPVLEREVKRMVEEERAAQRREIR